MSAKLKDWSLDILGKRFTVKWTKLADQYGKCESGKCLISVNPDYHPEQQKDALLHEVMHAIDLEMCSGLREKQIRRMATGLLHFMRTNPEVVRWLLEVER